MINSTERYVCVYGGENRHNRTYFVDFSLVDSVKGEFIKSKELKTFRTAHEANAYAKKKALELNAKLLSWDEGVDLSVINYKE